MTPSSQPVHSIEPELDTPDAELIAWEAELTELLLEHARLEAAWPKEATAVDRAPVRGKQSRRRRCSDCARVSLRAATVRGFSLYLLL